MNGPQDEKDLTLLHLWASAGGTVTIPDHTHIFVKRDQWEMLKPGTQLSADELRHQHVPRGADLAGWWAARRGAHTRDADRTACVRDLGGRRGQCHVGVDVVREVAALPAVRVPTGRVHPPCPPIG